MSAPGPVGRGGVASWPWSADDDRHLSAAADEALYAAKRAGGLSASSPPS